MWIPTTVRLQRVESRNVGNRTYHKYVLTIPEEIVTEAGWEAGGEVTANVQGKDVILSYSKGGGERLNSRSRRTDYEQFRDRIRAELISHPDGLSWPDLRSQLHLVQKVPNNVWVRRMERDIGLLRVKSRLGTRWRVG